MSMNSYFDLFMLYYSKKYDVELGYDYNGVKYNFDSTMIPFTKFGVDLSEFFIEFVNSTDYSENPHDYSNIIADLNKFMQKLNVINHFAWLPSVINTSASLINLDDDAYLVNMNEFLKNFELDDNNSIYLLLLVDRLRNIMMDRYIKDDISKILDIKDLHKMYDLAIFLARYNHLDVKSAMIKRENQEREKVRDRVTKAYTPVKRKPSINPNKKYSYYKPLLTHLGVESINTDMANKLNSMLNSLPVNVFRNLYGYFGRDLKGLYGSNSDSFVNMIDKSKFAMHLYDMNVPTPVIGCEFTGNLYDTFCKYPKEMFIDYIYSLDSLDFTYLCTIYDLKTGNFTNGVNLDEDTITRIYYIFSGLDAFCKPKKKNTSIFKN